MSKINEAKKLAKNDVQVDIDIQNVAGHLRHHLRKFVITYTNVTNIVVRVRSTNPAPYVNESLLISSHYDTGHTSPGCHDDGLPNVVMLETLQNLLSFADGSSLLHPVVFLFNGGEEITLCAAHGFVNHHPWINQISAFLNLEAAGTGGRPIVFQTTDSWIMRQYARANKGAWDQLVAKIFSRAMWFPLILISGYFQMQIFLVLIQHFIVMDMCIILEWRHVNF
jgi:hypothetical protein